ncbi:MAG TPA: ABC transporter ATP-binding protein [Chloroflexota bacterium]|nr:ABC transporter ATP-binding protein [Chloroflexota bacterium]
MIEIEGLRKTFRTRTAGARWWQSVVGGGPERTATALDGLSLSVEAGTFYSLLGANGAGKTTTMKVLCTLLIPDSGSARVAGYDVVDQPRQVRERLGVSIRGERSVYWKLTGRQNLEYFARLTGFRGPEMRRRVGEVVDVIGLSARIDDYVERYSMGMKQRLAIGCALVHEPPVLLLDEPTIGLDPHGARSLRTFIREDLCRQQGVTLLYTTHYMFEAEELSDRVAVLHGGRIVAEGTPAAVRASVATKEPVQIQVRQLRDEDLEALRGHPEVASVTCRLAQDEVSTLHITPEHQNVPLGPLVDMVTASGGQLISVNVVRPSLEDAFIALTGTSLTEAGDAVTTRAG